MSPLLVLSLRTVIFPVGMCGIASELLRRCCAERHVNRPVKCTLLLSCLNQARYVSTEFNKNIQHELTLQYVQRLWSVSMWAAERTGEVYGGILLARSQKR